jgi:TonB family protein
MRAPAPALKPIPPMPMAPQASGSGARAELPGWTPEPAPADDDFAQVAAQARLGVQRKVVDEAARHRRQRLLTACGVAVAVAGVLVFLIDKFYDPQARAREQAIAAEVSRMAEQQKVTDNLTLIEIDIENAIMNNDLDAARNELAKLIEKSPKHARREFLQASIDRAAELQKLAGKSVAPVPAQVIAPASVERARPRAVERAPVRAPERVAAREPERTNERNVPARTARDATSSAPRTYGAPISDLPRERSIALDAPINSPGTIAAPARRDNAFGGRTVEASDSALGRSAAAVADPVPSGSAEVAMPPVAAAAPPTPAPAPLDVTPAKIIKRVLPVPPSGISRKTSGYVIVRFNISESGRVGNVEVVESTPAGVFDESAAAAVRKWTYEPRRENGTAVASTGQARLVFDMAN